MRVPLSWLKEYVDLPESVQEIADRLTFAGIEVEGIETVGGTFDGVVVGEVRAVEKHANADKLSVCRVFDGVAELQVVCGAPNVQAGGKYPFAQLGAHLPAAKLTIEKRKVRGVESHGMLCAPDELGLDESHAGLLVLDGKWSAGTPLSAVLGPPETIFELEITPNRPDCLCMIGVARELAAMYGKTLRIPAAPAPDAATAAIRVTVEDREGCPRYTARQLTGVKIGPSPDWMQQRLEHAGIRAINNVVDITNYVMLECGQPLHAFDQELLAGGQIIVRRARAAEKMSTLDNLERALTPDTLLIADTEKPVALAGVMGGAGSEIRDQTATVLLESACFKPLSVRATSRRLGLSTESSYRFERGVDVENVDWASRRAADLMCQFAGAQLSPGVTDVYSHPPARRSITCRFAKITELVGVTASGAEIVATFKALGLDVADVTGTSCIVRPPAFRQDLEKEVDLAEEFIRIYGLDRIPTFPPRARINPAADDRPARETASLRQQLASLGLREIYSYSLVAPALLNQFAEAESARVVLPNPISAEESILRSSLVPQMVDTLGRNRARQIRSASLFELSRVFNVSGEETRMCVGLLGAAGRVGLDSGQPVDAEESYLWIKGIWENIAQMRRFGGWTLREAALPAFEAGCEIVADGRVIGRMGVVKSAIRKHWRMNDPVTVLEVEAEPLLKSARQAARFTAIPAYPSVERDVALLADESLRHDAVERVMRAAAPEELESIRLFDIFRGESLGTGRKSMAYALTYRSSTRTLTDEDANTYHERVKAALKRELRVELRET